MSLRFKSVAVSNFMGISNFATLFEKGLHVVSGPNGSGKSSIVEAVVWCLYGKTLRDLPSAKDVVRKDGEVAVVDVAFEVAVRAAESGRWMVSRTRSRLSSKLTLAHRYQKDDNWSPWTQGTVADTQKKLDELLKMDFRAFCSAVAFGGTSAFRFSSLSPKERMDVLDEASGASLYRKAAELTKEARKKAEVEAAALVQEANLASRRLQEVRNAYREVKEAAAGAEALAVEVFELGEVAKSEADLDKLRRRAQVARDAYDVAVARVASSKTVLLRIEEEEDALEASRLQEKCPECGRMVTFGTGRLKQLAGERIQVTALKARDEKKRVEAKEEHERAKRELEEAEERNVEARVAREKLAVLQRQVKAAAVVKEKADKLKRKLRAAKEDLHARNAAASAAKRHVDTLEYLEGVFSPTLVSSVIGAALPALNEKAAEVSDALAGPRVQFDAQAERRGRKELGLRVENERGADSYGGSSEGEKARLDLAAGMAIQSLISGGASCGVVFYDEVFDHLDAQGRERVAMLLKAEAKDKAVYLVTHSEELAGEVQADSRIVMPVEVPQ